MKLLGVINPSGIKPSFAIPVFGDQAGCCSQNIDDKDNVIAFDPLVLPKAILIRVAAETTVNLGDPALYGFQFNREAVVGTREQLCQILSDYQFEYLEQPFLCLDISEFMNDPIRRQNAIWAAYDMLAKENVEIANEWLESKDQALARSSEKREGAYQLGNLANERFANGDLSGAMSLHLEALLIFRESFDRTGQFITLRNLGVANLEVGKVAQAMEFYEQALAMLSEIGSQGASSKNARSIVDKSVLLKDLIRAIEFRLKMDIVSETRNQPTESQDAEHSRSIDIILGNIKEAHELLLRVRSIFREIAYADRKRKQLNDRSDVFSQRQAVEKPTIAEN